MYRDQWHMKYTLWKPSPLWINESRTHFSYTVYNQLLMICVSMRSCSGHQSIILWEKLKVCVQIRKISFGRFRAILVVVQEINMICIQSNDHGGHGSRICSMSKDFMLHIKDYTKCAKNRFFYCLKPILQPGWLSVPTMLNVDDKSTKIYKEKCITENINLSNKLECKIDWRWDKWHWGGVNKRGIWNAVCWKH